MASHNVAVRVENIVPAIRKNSISRLAPSWRVSREYTPLKGIYQLLLFDVTWEAYFGKIIPQKFTENGTGF
jgi:hypothetical protein